MKDKLIALYLEWVNDWLTFSKFADYHGLTEEEANTCISIGRRYHEENARMYKESNELIAKVDTEEKAWNDLATHNERFSGDE